MLVASAAACTDWDAYTRCFGSACADGAPGGEDAGATACPGNLLGNGGFEDSEAPWQPLDAESTVTRIAGGHAGESALEVCGESTAEYGVSDSAPSVASAAEGEQYQARAWIRTELADAQTVRLLLREKTGGGTFVNLESDNLDPSSSWIELMTPPLTVMADGNTLSINVVEQGPATAGRCFQLDDLCLQELE